MARRPRGPDNSVVILVAFAAGAASMLLIMTALTTRPSPPRLQPEAHTAPRAATIGPSRPTAEPLIVPDRPRAGPATPTGGASRTPVTGSIAELRRRGLLVPVAGVAASSLRSSFGDPRSGGRSHQAIDILAPRDTPVRAVDDGVIERLFLSEAGGRTIYQFDRTERYAYYYAHLERYAPGLKDGDRVSRGEIIGYVGTSGNAPPDTPHLHFAVFELEADKRWWEGQPLDPYLLWEE